MDVTGRFDLPLILPSQAQKHVTHNEALTLIDGLFHLVIKTAGELSPPVTAAVDDAFLVGAPAAGAWFGQEGKIAFNTDAGWRFCAPARGVIALFAAANELRIYDQSAWTALGGYLGALSFATLGINTTADAANRLAVRSNAALFTALEAASGGNGDIQLKLNKELPADISTLLFQSGFSGRAEIGLAGNDNFSFKVSPNGASWQTAILIDAATGSVTLSNDSVENSALANMPASRLKGRISAGAGDPEDLSAAQATSLLDQFTSVAKGLAPASGGGTANFLRADGNWASPASGASVAATQVPLDFGAAPVNSKTFSISHPSASIGQKVILVASADMPGILSADELEMDAFFASARVSSAGFIQALVTASPGPVSGIRNFNYLIL